MTDERVEELVDEMAAEFFSHSAIELDRHGPMGERGEVVFMRIVARELVVMQQKIDATNELHAENWEHVAAFIDIMEEFCNDSGTRSEISRLSFKIRENATKMKDTAE